MENLQAQIIRNGDWVSVPFMELKRGWVFRLVYPDGSILAAKGEDGIYTPILIASNDAYLNKDNVPAIDCDLSLTDTKKLKK